MTDRSLEPGRVDLRAIDEPADSARADRVIAAAIARVTAGADAPGDVFAGIEAYARPLVAIAAALLLAATGTLLLTRGGAEADTATNVVADWALSAHVPTNGELLAAFQGYGR